MKGSRSIRHCAGDEQSRARSRPKKKRFGHEVGEGRSCWLGPVFNSVGLSSRRGSTVHASYSWTHLNGVHAAYRCGPARFKPPDFVWSEAVGCEVWLRVGNQLRSVIPGRTLPPNPSTNNAGRPVLHLPPVFPICLKGAACGVSSTPAFFPRRPTRD